MRCHHGCLTSPLFLTYSKALQLLLIQSSQSDVKENHNHNS